MRIDEIVLLERFVNLFNDDPRKDEFKDEVYDILVRSYAPIGGIKGSGTESPERLKSIPFWKLAVKNGKVVAAILYKDKGGRKSVAVGTDGTLEGKRAIINMTGQEPKRSYSERSKTALAFFLKQDANAKDYLIPVDRVKKISKDTIIPYSDETFRAIDISDAERKSTEMTLDRFPFLKDFGYFRDINGEFYFKVMTGTPGQAIV